MYNEFNTYTSKHARGASEIEIHAREQEKKMNLMKAIYNMEADGNAAPKQKGTRNPFKALLGIFLAAF